MRADGRWRCIYSSAMNARIRGHLRQVLLVIAVVLAMYLLGSWTGRLLSGVIAGGHYDLYIWIDRLVFFLWGVLAGALLMKLLTWRLRWLALLALPVLVLLHRAERRVSAGAIESFRATSPMSLSGPTTFISAFPFWV